MIRIFLLVSAALLLSACLPLGVYYKEGAPVQASQDAKIACNSQAAKDVPQRILTRVIPGYHLPPRQRCNASGVCTSLPGRFVPPRYESYDANEELRAEAADLCMRRQGYQYTRLPACAPEIASREAPARTVRFPKLTPNACVIRNKGGSWRIVTP